MPADGAASSSALNGLPSQHGNFDLITRHDLEYAPGMSVEKWKSRETGLTVLWANFDSPLLNCYMTLASEIFEDSGVPHTLEHLIFLGSDLYPFKGVLDTLANRAFASGTNAWTANDHTAYTLTTAGSDGFLRMLPVYLDHVFFPTLTSEGFTTEVYHVNGKGQDAGVVFSEMQGRENSPADLMELKSQRMLYPASSAYRSETGGLMSALRVLNIDKIRDYHQQYYAPHNAALVVCGPLARADLLDSLAPVEERLKSKRNAQPEGPRGWKRPFVETDSAVPPTIDGSKTEQPGLDPADPPAEGSKPDPKRRRAFVDFPEKDESVGEIQVSWVGPRFQDWMTCEAVNILSTYLTDSPVSAIQKAFVERDDPLCTDAYIGASDKAGASLLSAYFSSVPSEQLDKLDQQLINLLAGIVKDGIDMDRMQMVIKRDKLKVLSQLETKPADSFADLLITDFLYGNRNGDDLHTALEDMKRYDELVTWKNEQWTELIQKFFIDNPRLVVIGRPSSALSDKLKADTKALEERRRKELGEDGLKKLEDQLEAAKKENDRPIPDEMLKQFQIPNTDSIKWIPVGTAQVLPTAAGKLRTGDTTAYGLKVQNTADDLDKQIQAHVDADTAELPYFVQFDHVNSAFVSISLVFATTDLPKELRAQMQLYLSVLFSLPVVKQDASKASLTYEQVVKGLDEDTLEYDVSLGSGGFGELVCAELKLERANYEKGIAWLRDLFWGSQFAVDRLKVSISKIIQSLPEQKRNGRAIASALSRQLTHDGDKSTNLANSILNLVKTMPELQEQLNNDPQKVVDDFERIRSTLLRPENLRVSVAGDILALDKPKASWAQHFTRSDWVAKDTLPVPWSKDMLTELGRSPSRKGLITALPTVESSYSYFTTKGISSYTHPDAPALITTITILNAMESYLWRYIRGAGLAYGASIVSNPESELIHFSLYRSPDSAKAFLEARKVIQALCAEAKPSPSSSSSTETTTTEKTDGEELVLEIDETTLESAKSSLHFNIAEAEGTVSGAAQESFFDQVLKQSPKHRGKILLSAVQKVTLADVKRSLKQYILPLFDARTSVAAVVAPQSKVDEIQTQLQGVGYEMERVEIDLGKDDDEDGSESGSGSGSEDESAGGSESESEDEGGRR